MIREFLRSPCEIQNLFMFAWFLSGRSSCIMLYTSLRCGLFATPVGSSSNPNGGELGIPLGGSLICSNLWFRNNKSQESAIRVCETLVQDLVKTEIQSKLSLDSEMHELSSR